MIDTGAPRKNLQRALGTVTLDGALKAQHGDALTEIVELERGIAIAEYAVEAVRTEIARDVGSDPHEFNRLAAPYETKVTAPFLKKFVENGTEKIRVLKMNGNGGVWAEATPSERESGHILWLVRGMAGSTRSTIMTEKYPNKQDQLTATRRLLAEMCPTASKAIGDFTNAKIDGVVARSTPMTPTK